MKLENDIKEIREALAEQEKRISRLESEGLVLKTSKTPNETKVSIPDHLARLKTEGFFNQPRSTQEIVSELAKEGYHYPPESLTAPLQRAIRGKELGRIKKENKWAYCKR